MNLLPEMALYLTVGCGEWYLALRRTLACARGEKTILVLIVFIENLLGLWVLSNFVRTNNWLLALSYAAGAAAGALIMAFNGKEKSARTTASSTSRHAHDAAAQPSSFVRGTWQWANRVRGYRERLSKRRSLRRIHRPDLS